MKDVRTNDAPKPAGHYSQAIVHDGLVYVSGQLPIDPKREEKYGGVSRNKLSRHCEIWTRF